MPYDSIVCVKQVPDTANITAEAMKEDGTVNRAALPTVFNPEDLHALETALEVRDEYGGTVTVISMGPPKAADVLRESLYRGADRAILLTDRRAAASDTLATSYILAQAVRTIGRYDLVFCGRQAIDGDTAQVGPQCAEKLGIPQITYLQELLGIHDRDSPHAAEHRPRLGDRRSQAARADHRVGIGERAAAGGGQAGHAVEAGQGAGRSGRGSEGRHARGLRGQLAAETGRRIDVAQSGRPAGRAMGPGRDPRRPGALRAGRLAHEGPPRPGDRVDEGRLHRGSRPPRPASAN